MCTGTSSGRSWRDAAGLAGEITTRFSDLRVSGRKHANRNQGCDIPFVEMPQTIPEAILAKCKTPKRIPEPFLQNAKVPNWTPEAILQDAKRLKPFPEPILPVLRWRPVRIGWCHGDGSSS